MKRIFLSIALFIFCSQLYAETIKPIGVLTLTAEIQSTDAESTTGFLYIKSSNGIEIVAPIPVHFSASTGAQAAGNNYIGSFIKNVNGHPVTYYVYLSGTAPRISLPTKLIKQV